jgi:hypothetical protein
MFNPFKKKVAPPPTPPPQPHWLTHKIWVRLPDGRVGVIDHLKNDGHMGVRPITAQGEYFPNTSPHWEMADRLRVPEEVRIHTKDLTPLRYDEIPPEFRKEPEF